MCIYTREEQDNPGWSGSLQQAPVFKYKTIDYKTIDYITIDYISECFQYGIILFLVGKCLGQRQKQFVAYFICPISIFGGH